MKNKYLRKAAEILLSFVPAIIIYFILSYFICPAINIHSGLFWFTAAISFIAGSILFMIASFIFVKDDSEKEGFSFFRSAASGIITGGVIVVLLILSFLLCSPFFNAKTYRNRIDVEIKNEEDFYTDIPDTQDISKIALMDTASAQKLGDRVLGSLSDVVSQFEIGDYYTIELNGNVMKVAPLNYGGFFKWMSNKSDGIPGYVLVNPLTSEATYVKVEDGIKYSPSAYLGNDLIRHVRSEYKTKMLGDYTFQLDNDNNPYWVVTTMKNNRFISCEVPEGAILCNAVTGECTYYSLEDIPEWVDDIFMGDLVCELYDSYGRYVNGFINFSMKGVTSTTDDFGYLCVGSDIYYYTGITSAASDESNIGFILVNSRTGKFSYYQIPGAEEYSAMSAAEGVVQNYGYTASFPSLVNIDGNPTYVMVLKDSSGLVKMYAMVNVKNYTVVAAAETLSKCLSQYGSALKNAGTSVDISDVGAGSEVTFTIKDIEYVTIEGNTIVYIKGDNGKVYKQPFAENEDLILFNIGDKVTVTYSGESDIIAIVSIK